MERKAAKCAGRRAGERGVTLIELMITVTITGMLMATISLIMRDAFRASFSQRARLEMTRDSRLAMNIMVKQIHSGSASSAIISEYSDSSPTIPYSMLSFRRWDAGTWRTRFYLEVLADENGVERGRLVYEHPYVAPDGVTITARNVLATGLTNFGFTYPSWRQENRLIVNIGMLRHKYEGQIINHQVKEIVEFKNP